MGNDGNRASVIGAGGTPEASRAMLDKGDDLIVEGSKLGLHSSSFLFHGESNELADGAKHTTPKPGCHRPLGH
jgi:hypothetical protein